jgi:Cys-rich protein (TIGR01571 family)
VRSDNCSFSTENFRLLDFQAVSSASWVAKNRLSREKFLHEMPFSTGLCDCCSDTGSCLDVFFCGLCHLSRVEMAINFQPDTCSFICPCCALCHLCGVQNLMAQRFAPETDISHGCCTVLFCAPCVLCQTSRELTIRQMNPGGTCCKSGIVPSKPPASPVKMLAQIQEQIQMMNQKMHQPNAV